MKIIDSIILIAALWYAYKGYKRGFFGEIFHILAFIIGTWAAIYGNKIILNYISVSESFAGILSVVIAFAIATAIVLLFGKFFQSLFTSILSDTANNILGAIFGLFKITFIAGLVFCCIEKVDVEQKLLTQERKQTSLCYKPCTSVVNVFAPKFQEIKLRIHQLRPKNNHTTNID